MLISAPNVDAFRDKKAKSSQAESTGSAGRAISFRVLKLCDLSYEITRGVNALGRKQSQVRELSCAVLPTSVWYFAIRKDHRI